jgi:hypothetical protein
MNKRTSSASGNRDSGDVKKFSSLTRHLKDRDFKWLKEDVGFFGLIEDSDWPLDLASPIAHSTIRQRS